MVKAKKGEEPLLSLSVVFCVRCCSFSVLLLVCFRLQLECTEDEGMRYWAAASDLMMDGQVNTKGILYCLNSYYQNIFYYVINKVLLFGSHIYYYPLFYDER